jgi:uncharacterized protein YlxP (DUF503 family)
MVIGYLSLEFFFPYCRSLKDKRQIVNSFKERIKRKYNVSIAELDYQDKWQRTRIGIVTLNSQQAIVEDRLNKILAEARGNVHEAELLQYETRYF